jgi:hypothetical protein
MVNSVERVGFVSTPLLVVSVETGQGAPLQIEGGFRTLQRQQISRTLLRRPESGSSYLLVAKPSAHLIAFGVPIRLSPIGTWILVVSL